MNETKLAANSSLLCSLFILLFFHQLQPLQAQQAPYAPYGGVFTPKGNLRVLLVFVTYKDGATSNPNFRNADYKLPDWDYTTNNRLPNFVNSKTGDCTSYMYNEAEDFDKESANDAVTNFSEQFALMSNGKFKMIAEVFSDAAGNPTVVEVDPTGGYSWTDMNRRAIKEMAKINPKADLSRFDERTNRPNFKFDNSNTEAHPSDKVLDFVIFIHRYNKGWRQAPHKGMPAWVGSGGGFAGTGVPAHERINGYRVAEGFTMTYNSGVFIHEVAHVLFNAPHIMGVNNVIGDYFYLMSAGWGVMAPISIFGGFNAWERWYVGFSELKADIESEADLAAGNQFVLRDYFTTGEAIRIAIPFSGGQHLWLENHAKLHSLDEHPWKGSIMGMGDTIVGSASGVYAYVEAIAGSRHEIFSTLSDRANGIKVLHAGGNYDYRIREDLPLLKNNWGNKMKSFERLEENPIAGLNNFYRFPYDENGDGTIKLDENYNASKTEWYPAIYREAIEVDSFVNTYGAFGVYNSAALSDYVGPVAFRDGDYLDMGSNPMPLNYPRYNKKTKQLAPYRLNGLGVKFETIPNSTDMLVTVRFKQVDLCQNRRWTGSIELPNITADAAPDLVVGNCKTLLLDKGQTPNTHLKTPEGDFVNPTTLTVLTGATFQLKANATLIIRANSKLVIEEGATLLLDKKSKIIVEKGAELQVHAKASLKQHRLAKIKQAG